MKNSFFIVLPLVFAACQSTLIKKERYKVSPAVTELGSIGQATSLFNLQNEYEVRTLPTLENNIRVAIEILPFTKRLNKLYLSKEKYNQNLSKLIYIDSLPYKPEFVTIQLLDVTGFVNELNANYNTSVLRLLKDTPNSKVVSAVAISVSNEDIAKLRQADTYYLTNSLEKKYTLSLYKSGKKIETIHLHPETIIAYQLSTFCWASTERGKWYVADIIEGSNNCKGNTTSKISEKKKSKSLYSM
jgi:hypothetical protein